MKKDKDKKSDLAIATPRTSSDREWTVKIARAKQVREGTVKMREGKATAFQTQRLSP